MKDINRSQIWLRMNGRIDKGHHGFSMLKIISEVNRRFLFTSYRTLFSRRRDEGVRIYFVTFSIHYVHYSEKHNLKFSR